MSGSEYRLILFDVDNTLLDFQASEENAIKLCWERFFNHAISLESYAQEFRVINLQVWHDVEAGKLKPPLVSFERARRTLKRFGLRTKNAEELGRLFARGLGEIASWLPFAEEGFTRIASRYKVGLVTNGLTGVQHSRINSLGIRPILSALQISEEAGTSKPRPEIFFRALREAGERKEQALVVGDSVSSDFQGAVNAGIDFCWVKHNPDFLPFGFPSPKYRVSSIHELDSLLP